MKTLTFTRPNRLNRLHEELLNAGIQPYTVLGDESAVTLVVDDAIESAAVASVVNAHDASKYDALDAQRHARDDKDGKTLQDVLKLLASGATWDGLSAQQRTAMVVAIGRRVLE